MVALFFLICRVLTIKLTVYGVFRNELEQNNPGKDILVWSVLMLSFMCPDKKLCYGNNTG